jgi:hypothetical protein
MLLIHVREISAEAGGGDELRQLEDTTVNSLIFEVHKGKIVKM